MKKFNILKVFVLASLMMPAIFVQAQSKLDKQVLMTIATSSRRRVSTNTSTCSPPSA